jgi:hypothetical protein
MSAHKESESAWLPHAECVKPHNRHIDMTQNYDPKIDREKIDRAKNICASCVSIKHCLDYALENPVAGIAGGLTSDERRKLRKNLSAQTSQNPY